MKYFFKKYRINYLVPCIRDKVQSCSPSSMDCTEWCSMCLQMWRALPAPTIQAWSLSHMYTQSCAMAYWASDSDENKTINREESKQFDCSYQILPISRIQRSWLQSEGCELLHSLPHFNFSFPHAPLIVVNLNTQMSISFKTYLWAYACGCWWWWWKWW